MIILRKFMLAFAAAAVITVCAFSGADAKAKAGKYTGPLLKGVSMYQIGENEFILKLSGRNMPEPDCKTDRKSLLITFYRSKIYHPEKIISSLKSTIETIPLVNGFNAENLSDDDTFWAEVSVEANVPLKVHSVSRSNDGYSVRVKPAANEGGLLGGAAYVPPPKTAETPLFSVPFSVDAKITIELRDAELRDVIRGIMSYIGRNVIIDPSFPKDVLLTMTMNDVRADELLNYIMRTYDIACYKSGMNTLTFGSVNGLYKLSGERSVKQFRLHYAEAAQVSSILRSITAIEENAITIDERMRTLYVRTNPAKMEEVTELIGLLDTPQKQVMIRASIFEFNDDDSLAVQNALEIAYDDIRLVLGGDSDGYSGIGVRYRADRTLIGTREVWTDRYITTAFSALEQKAKGKVLANPSVIAVDGKQAEINLTQDYPYVSDRDNSKGTVTWSTEEVGPKLKFTPRIGRDGYVTLTLDLSTGDVVGTMTSGTGGEMPVTTTRSVKTDVRVRDGMPFVIGGLFHENTSKNVSRIPILGNIPLLGELFTFRSNSKTKNQVVMVITPYILDAD
ncbi:MAG: hypothetical protein IJP86_07050 [Synergistaceae bacterium]|nr:hypothetical protein [Synergistaceae bacterium]